MKRILAVLMITLGIGSVFANATTSEKEATPQKTYKVYTAIEISELPETVQEVLFFDFKDYIVKSADVKTYNGKNIYLITLLDSENMEYQIYINEKGVVLE
ncbi:hypothetical protein [uncultured Bacteroides sp.]|uniref:hypothetical protein n=1 Tax=uncultured Bacteroides sp. TaxID=162156 RepID=UPI002627F98E|nr:hypothetical protein [uncultured Bacteroides sp.]